MQANCDCPRQGLFICPLVALEYQVKRMLVRLLIEELLPMDCSGPMLPSPGKSGRRADKSPKLNSRSRKDTPIYVWRKTRSDHAFSLKVR